MQGGEYLPLSVYEKRGFDIDAIREKCTDTEEHPVLGTAYTVCIRSNFSKTVEPK